MSSPDAEVDGSVCYRHPDRTSWTLCQRCGRTICPECQILTPSGVRCPDCVREAGGSVRWEPAAGKPAAKSAPKTDDTRRPAGRAPALDAGAARHPDPGIPPVLTWGIGGIVLVLWIAGFATANAPVHRSGRHPGPVWEVWRYFTSEFVYPSVGGRSQSWSSVILSLHLPGTHLAVVRTTRRGRRRYLVLFFASAAFGAAGMMLAGADRLRADRSDPVGHLGRLHRHHLGAHPGAQPRC